MGRGSIEHAWLAALERTAKLSLCLSGSMSFVHRRVCPRSKDCRTDKTPCFRGAGAAFQLEGQLFNEQGVFSFLLSLSFQCVEFR